MKQLIALLVALSVILVACGPTSQSSNDIARQRQEEQLSQAVAQVGMPALPNLRTFRLVKYIFEMCDKEVSTYTYLWSEFNGKAVFLCNSIGFPVPYASQLTAPESMQFYNLGRRPGGASGEGRVYGHAVLPQADPDGVFKPASAEATWIVCLNPITGKKADPGFVEPRTMAFPFPLPCHMTADCDPAKGGLAALGVGVVPGQTK